MNYVGIDISKKFFDVAINNSDRYEYFKFENTNSGFRQLLKLLTPDHCCVMEASGPYYQKLAAYLVCRQLKVSVVNPLVIRRFCQMRLTRAKTDKKDAAMIAGYGKTEQPALWQPSEAFVLELKQLQALMEQLNKTRTNFMRQQEAFGQSVVISKDVKKAISLMIKTTQMHIQELEIKMHKIISRHYNQMHAQLKSIPGIGNKTALMLIVASGGFTKFGSAKQLSSYFGLSPRIFESGSSVKAKARICKMGMSKIRSMLYVCSWSAIKCNAACKSLYERLVEKGKAKMVALIAVANKLLKQAFAIVTKNQFYDQNYFIKN